jgi:hypothetical protein
MDTKFWGPSGWRLLHTLTFTYQPAKQKAAMRDFLETLPFVLPCKFCRHSLTEYYCADAPDLTSAATLSRWLWRIHNKVNTKLRSQGQTLPPDPTYAAVKRMYSESLPTNGNEACQSFPGWDFLFSIAYSHPLTVKGKPMPDEMEVPTKCQHLTVDQEENRMNRLAPMKRLKFWNRFWATLPLVMPPAWAKAWTGAADDLKSRAEATKWLWRIRCDFSHGADPYRQVCQRLATYESGCSKSLRARTCRRTRKKA